MAGHRGHGPARPNRGTGRGRLGHAAAATAALAPASAVQPACKCHQHHSLLTLHSCHYLLPLLPARPGAAPPVRQAAGASGAQLHGHAASKHLRADCWSSGAGTRPRGRVGGIGCCETSFSLQQCFKGPPRLWYAVRASEERPPPASIHALVEASKACATCGFLPNAYFCSRIRTWQSCCESLASLQSVPAASPVFGLGPQAAWSASDRCCITRRLLRHLFSDTRATMSSYVDQVLAKFKQGQKAALKLQTEARQEREEKLAKAAAGGHSCEHPLRPSRRPLLAVPFCAQL